MTNHLNLGDIQVTSIDAESLYVHGKGKAEIQTAAGLKPLRAMVAVDTLAKKVIVHISSGDLAGLPYTTGMVVIVDSLAGWTGSASVS